MNPFDIGTLRQAMDTLRFEGANDLVQRTLSQHGLAMPLPASGPAAEAPTSDALASGASFTADRFACTAGTRDYLTYVPASAAQGTQGLVLMLHGCTQTHADFARGTGMNALADSTL